MSSKLKILVQLLKSFSNQSNYGDIILLKAELFGLKTRRQLVLDGLVKDGRDIDLEVLFDKPLNTFGHQYAYFLKQRGITPFTFNPELRVIANRRPAICRQMVAHDFLHVVLGFDTTYDGEMGVLSFLVGQNYTRWQKVLFLIALVVYPLVSPLETFKIYRNAVRGYYLGKLCKRSALEFQFEKYFSLPLEYLRYDFFKDAQEGQNRILLVTTD